MRFARRGKIAVLTVPDQRLIAGSLDGLHRLDECVLNAGALVVEPVDTLGARFVAVIGCSGGTVAVDGQLATWRMLAGEVCCSAHLGPLRVHAAAGPPSVILVWRFAAAVLNPGLAGLLLPFAAYRRPFSGPRPMDATERAIVQGLRSCPVAPNLRPFWANAKLSELVTHLVPASASTTTPVPEAGVEQPAAQRTVPEPIRRALDLMRARYDEPLRLEDLARAAGMSPSHFSRVFSQALGCGPAEHLRRIRLEAAARLLSAGAMNVTEASLACGYGSLAQFSRAFKAHHGRPPSAWAPRRG